MDDHEVLQHLLGLEAEAAALVNDAQIEADRRISEAEKQNNFLFEEAYAKEVEAEEANLVQSIEAVNENYRNQLEAYRKTLLAVTPDIDSFSALARQFLFAKENENAK
jgi:regulator of protease activity HflC (stomatin/prohibitin superfamily)